MAKVSVIVRVRSNICVRSRARAFGFRLDLVLLLG